MYIFFVLQLFLDQYVPIRIVANFPKIAQLTKDYDLIVKILLCMCLKF